MADVLIADWIEEYETLTESEIHTYATEQEHNQEVVVALHVLFDEDQEFQRKHNLIDRVCNQLLSFYRSGEENLRKFAMQYIPNLVYLHLNDRNTHQSVGTLLITFYNLEVVDSKGQPKVRSFRVPSVAQSSIYHDCGTLEPAFTAQNSLRRWEECNTKLVNWGPLPQVEVLNAQNRQRVLTALVFLYNQQIASVSLQGVEHSCRTISRLVSQGFQVSGSQRTSADSDTLSGCRELPRLTVSSQLLVEFLHVVAHALHRGASGAAQTLHDVMQRGNYDTYADVLLLAHAISNLSHRSPTALMPAKPPKPVVAKSMITNASFRTKKLPDDIPIQDQDEAGAGGDASLDSIVEEGGADASDKKSFRGRSGSALKHLPKLPGLGKRPKLKNSPTPPRHSLEDSVTDLRLNAVPAGGGTGGGGGGDQVALVIGSTTNGTVQNEIGHGTVHVSTV